MGRSPRVQSQPGMVAHGRGGGRQIPGACCPTNLSQSPSAVPVRDCLRYTQTHMHMHARTHAHVCTHNPRIPTCSDLKKQLERGSLGGSLWPSPRYLCPHWAASHRQHEARTSTHPSRQMLTTAGARRTLPPHRPLRHSYHLCGPGC